MTDLKTSKNSINDQFFTNRETANKIVEYCFKEFPELKDKEFFECSAGDGAFVDALKFNGVEDRNIFGIDIDPKRSDICKADFLKDYVNLSGKVVISNPPFGKFTSLIRRFTLRAFELNAEYVIWYAPFSFTKNITKYLLKKGVVIKKIKICNDNSFLLPDGTIYKLDNMFTMAIFVLKRDPNYMLKNLVN